VPVYPFCTVGPLELSLQRVPKMVGMLTRTWCPEAYVISFKLETDEALLVPKVCVMAFGHPMLWLCVCVPYARGCACSRQP